MFHPTLSISVTVLAFVLVYYLFTIFKEILFYISIPISSPSPHPFPTPPYIHSSEKARGQENLSHPLRQDQEPPHFISADQGISP